MIKFNDKMIKFFKYYTTTEKKDARCFLYGWSYNINEKRVEATEGHKLVLIKESYGLVSDYCNWYNDIVKDKTHNYIFNLPFYNKYYKTLPIEIEPVGGVYSMVVRDIKGNIIDRSSPYDVYYPDFEHLINYDPNISTIINVKDTLTYCKSILKRIKEHNKLNKLMNKNDDLVGDHNLKVKLSLNSMQKRLFIQLADDIKNPNISLIKDYDELLSYSHYDILSDVNTNNIMYCSLNYLMDVLNSFSLLKIEEVKLTIKLLEKNHYPLKFNAINNEINAYIMPINN